MQWFLKYSQFGSLLSPKASPHALLLRHTESERCEIQERLMNSKSVVDKHHPHLDLCFNKSLFLKWTPLLDDFFTSLLVRLIAAELARFGLHLPKDLVGEILLRFGLDPGALILCKYRCKLWYELINSRSFVDKDLRFNIHNHNNSLFLRWTRMLDDIFFDLLSKPAQEVQSLLTVSKDESDSSVSLSLVPKKLDILAAFLLSPRDKQERLAVLCNPALKIFPSNFDFGFGFGFDFEAAGEGAATGLYLPEEIAEDILLRLSPESLMVCKCVCKLWYDLINRQSFVDKHLHFNIEKKHYNNNHSVSLFLKWTRQELSEHEIFMGHQNVRCYHANDLSKQVLSLVTLSTDDDDDDASGGDVLPNCIIEQVSLPPFVVEKICVQELINVNQRIDNLAAIHCHGIICLFDEQRRSTLILCNPALRTFKIFHPPRPFGFRSLGLGFGYDPIANVYKLVRIYGSIYPNQQVTRAKVYTLGTDTDSWREIVAPKQYCSLYPKGLYCRGVFYWWNLINRCSTIVSFDMSEEEFHFIPAPDDAVGENRKMHELALWNESVVIFFSTEFSWFSTSFEMWVMVDSPGGYGTYWRKHLTIGPLARIYSPLQFWKDDELLMETRDGLIVSYNLHTQNLRKLPIPSGALFPGSTYASLCFKSLVLF